MVRKGYYARDTHDKNLDDFIRRNVKKNNDPALMALYLQGQEILNLLRRIVPVEKKEDSVEV